MQAVESDGIQSPICFTCGCKFPFVENRVRNDISWEQPFRASPTQKSKITHFFTLDDEQTEQAFGLEQYLEDYGLVHKGTRNSAEVHLREHMDEFEDWTIKIPFAGVKGRRGRQISILCCPEDRKCLHQLSKWKKPCLP